MSDYFTSASTSATESEKAMYAYIQLIVMRNQPISIVEDKMFRDFSKFNERFSRKTLKEVIFCLVELVEGIISSEMRSTRGSIAYDGWTDSGTHYIGIFAVYERKSNCIRGFLYIITI